MEVAHGGDLTITVAAAGVVLAEVVVDSTGGGVTVWEVVGPTTPPGLSQESPTVVASNADLASG